MTCPKCKGRGWFTTKTTLKECPNCFGEGEIHAAA